MKEGNEASSTEAVADPQVEQEVEKKPTNWLLIIRLLLAAVIAVLFMTFVFQNTESTSVEFLSGDTSVATSLLILFSALAGIVIWELAGFVSRRARKK